ncbi:MAG: hypothetical protein BGO98_27175 [Myxococcales bacterium 68-20]|nr:hypothetical protein [Myxococcales bacterium]OJY30407.1 MAG: hypothetical protein BGO98_27175 [Myxococcales bacterium 68-20]
MTSPKRLLEEGSSFDRTLLRAARADRPSPELERRLIAAACGAVVPAPPASTTRPSLLARLGRSRFVAIGAIGIGASMLAVVSGESATPIAETSTPAVANPAPLTEAREEAPPTVEISPSESLAVTTPDALPNVVTPAAVVPTSSPAAVTLVRREAVVLAAAPSTNEVPAPAEATAPATEASLQREVELLDAVKRSLRASALDAAERELDAYDAEFRRGTLKPEAGVLRIRLMLAKGDRAGATALGDELLRHHPDSVHAKRIRAVLAADGGDGTRTQTSPR